MTKKFLITGLPRSRTAWMAEVCTTKHSTCYHEPIKKMDRWQDVYQLWRQPGIIGVSDSSLGFHLGQILDIAAPRTLVILRDLGEVERSLRAQGFPEVPRYCHVLQNRISMLIDHPLVRTVRFESLADTEVVEMCLRHLMLDTPIDRERLDNLMDVNIQVDTSVIKMDVASREINLGNLLGEDVIQEIFPHV